MRYPGGVVRGEIPGGVVTGMRYPGVISVVVVLTSAPSQAYAKNTTVLEQPLDFTHLAEKYNAFVTDFIDRCRGSGGTP